MPILPSPGKTCLPLQRGKGEMGISSWAQKIPKEPIFIQCKMYAAFLPPYLKSFCSSPYKFCYQCYFCDNFCRCRKRGVDPEITKQKWLSLRKNFSKRSTNLDAVMISLCLAYDTKILQPRN